MATKTKTTKSSSSKPANKGKQKKVVQKKHGTILMIVLVFIALHGLAAAILYSTARTDPDIQRPWLISMMVVHFLANVAAAVGIYYWKKWGLYVYAGSTVIAVIAGLLSIGMWSVFYMVLPLAILGWILRDKWNYFETP